MSRYDIRTTLTLFAGLLLVWFQSCAEKPAAKPIVGSNLSENCKQTNTQNPSSGFGSGNPSGTVNNANTANSCNQVAPAGGPSTAVTNSTDLCTVLQSDSYLSSKFAAFVGALCGNGGSTLSLLRSEQYAYKGNGTPVLKIDSKVSTVQRDDDLARSEMQAYGSFLTPATPLSYFELMQMKIDKPSVFTSTYPADTLPAANTVEYTKISGSVASGVRYRYVNKTSTSTDAGDVDYEATAKFLTLVPNQTYVVTTEFELKHDMVDGTRGLSIIHLKSPGVTEVISVSDQIFENGDNHDSAVDDAKKNLERDLNYSYRQALFKHENLDK